ncbi:MAG: hypothetical protein HZA49_02560 [Planctomycetes bacterium]|nr:hypothetical protein [Planctomycetota bacterium]
MSFHLVGIDEAGYGPQLGPLVVSAVVLELPNDLLIKHPLPRIKCLWKILSNIISERKCPAKITVCDSKALYTPARGLKELEKTALVFRRLIKPNYRCHGKLNLPLSADNTEIKSLTKLLRTEFNHNSIRFRDAQVSIIEPADFNDGIQRLQNKADFLWEISGNLIKHCIDKYSHDNILVVRAGKQGGRNYYFPHLQRLFTDKTVRPVMQGFNNSSYTIGSKSQVTAVVSFIKDGDASEFVIALASIFSKYYRELAMFQLNRLFQSHIPSLKPTSGYHTDSRRFIQAVNPLFNQLNLDRNNFIRIR